MDNEIIETVRRLNDLFFDEKLECFPQEILPFEYKTNGFSDVVLFMDMAIWSSDDETRNFIENEGYESFDLCFIREAMKIIKILAKRKNILQSYKPKEVK